MESKRPYNTVNTFSRRPCINQIISYIIIIFGNITFWLLIQTNYESRSCRFTMITFFACSVIIMLLLGCLTSSYDPSDPIMTEYRNGNTTIIQGKYNQCLYCEHCQSYVYNTSRHCKPCDRCVDQFDHHCIWINNCIGKGNYKIFMGMILSAEGHLTIYITSVLLLWTENNWNNFMSSMIVIWSVFSAILIFSILLLGLIILHFFLIYNNLTTYQYMVSKKNAQIVPKPKIQIGSNTHFRTSSNDNSPNKSNPDNIQTDYANRTSNFLPPTSGFKNFQKQLDKVSAFKSIDSLEQFKKEDQTDSKANYFVERENRKIENQQYKEGFEEFYKTHRGLKILIGNGVNIKSKKSRSCKQIRPNENENQQNSKANNSQYKELDQINKAKEKFQNMNIIFENDL